MKKVTKPSHASDRIREYSFIGGVRGKYAEQVRESSPTTERPSVLRVWAPLVGLSWTGLERQIAEDAWIKNGSAFKGYEYDEYFISRAERDVCRETPHWLFLAHPAQHGLSTREAINSFLLALWMVKPTRTHAPLRFEEGESGVHTTSRLLDRFQWIEGQVKDEIQDRDLDIAATMLPRLRDIYIDRRRLRTALTLTYRGCVSVDWQAAFLCFATAMEAMLTYSDDPGLSRRLAKGYAHVMKASKVEGRTSEADFIRLYEVRSEIVHGNTSKRSLPGRNLSVLREFSDLLRRLWCAVLRSGQIRSVLEGDDATRGAFFSKS